MVGDKVSLIDDITQVKSGYKYWGASWPITSQIQNYIEQTAIGDGVEVTSVVMEVSKVHHNVSGKLSSVMIKGCFLNQLWPPEVLKVVVPIVKIKRVKLFRQ